MIAVSFSSKEIKFILCPNFKINRCSRAFQNINYYKQLLCSCTLRAIWWKKFSLSPPHYSLNSSNCSFANTANKFIRGILQTQDASVAWYSIRPCINRLCTMKFVLGKLFGSGINMYYLSKYLPYCLFCLPWYLGKIFPHWSNRYHFSLTSYQIVNPKPLQNMFLLSLHGNDVLK